ncbi:radical SAM protein [Azospirillum sp. TSH64]|uniref:radical SAM/SPASM domain-containing protein n=1 Tax=Azospirillum sp. TSH64 TaxID=652740 RepID=UPI000D64888D|nr:radical SAM protein [Azospirillum sp. TSH64]
MSFRVAPPGLFQVEITNVCNIDCAMCARPAGLNRNIGHMDLDLFKTIVDQSWVNQMPIHWFHHFGETLAYPYLREALSYFKEHGYGPGRVSTNAILLNDEKIDLLLENASYVLCCLDSMQPEAYRRIRNNNHFEKVKDNISKFIRENERRGSNTTIVVQFLRTSYNQDEDFSMMAEHFGRHQNVKFIEKRTDKHPNGGDLTLFLPEDEVENRRNCVKLKTELCILVDGTCVPCCWDAKGEQPIGKVPDEDIGAIWHGHRHREMQRQLKDGVNGKLSLCDRCAGPVSDSLFGIAERINAWAGEWARDKRRVVLAPTNPMILKLLENTALRDVNVVALADREPRGKTSSHGIPVVSYDEIGAFAPDLMFVFSPAYSSEIYFDQRHWREKGLELVVLGGYLD